MKFKICLFVLLAAAPVAQGQSFRDIETLKEMRKDLPGKRVEQYFCTFSV